MTYDESVSWTDYAIKELSETSCKWPDGIEWGFEPTGILGYKPLRGKQYLKNMGELAPVISKPSNLATNKAIVGRDKFDVMTCDAMLVNLLGAKRVSIGTMFEMAWCHLLQKPQVVVMEKEGNLHEHAFVLECGTHYTDSLDEGIAIIKRILLP